jgi:hypothetical protein
LPCLPRLYIPWLKLASENSLGILYFNECPTGVKLLIKRHWEPCWNHNAFFFLLLLFLLLHISFSIGERANYFPVTFAAALKRGKGDNFQK